MGTTIGFNSFKIPCKLITPEDIGRITRLADVAKAFRFEVLNDNAVNWKRNNEQVNLELQLKCQPDPLFRFYNIPPTVDIPQKFYVNLIPSLSEKALFGPELDVLALNKQEETTEKMVSGAISRVECSFCFINEQFSLFISEYQVSAKYFTFSRQLRKARYNGWRDIFLRELEARAIGAKVKYVTAKNSFNGQADIGMSPDIARGFYHLPFEHQGYKNQQVNLDWVVQQDKFDSGLWVKLLKNQPS